MSANVRTVYFTITRADFSCRVERVGPRRMFSRGHTQNTRLSTQRGNTSQLLIKKPERHSSAGERGSATPQIWGISCEP